MSQTKFANTIKPAGLICVLVHPTTAQNVFIVLIGNSKMQSITAAEYLEKLASKLKLNSAPISKELEGSSPPSVFVGRSGWPKVYAGPMLAQQKNNSEILDAPEQWIGNKEINDVVDFRLGLIRGKNLVKVNDVETKFIRQMQEIALAKRFVLANAEFKKEPKGFSFSEEHQPFGPSAQLEKFENENVKFDSKLEKAFYDKDLKARNAVIELNKNGVPTSQIQKAFSVGSFGLGKSRKLVPTRWSITAVDSALGENFLQNVKENPVIGSFQVYEFESFHNKYEVILTPTQWQYEFNEAFIRVLGDEEVIFSDFEKFKKKTAYSEIGGCYYSARLAVAEHLACLGRQAGAIILRESYPDYIPLGVWNVRENMRAALKQAPREFSSFSDAFGFARGRLWLPEERWLATGNLLREVRTQKRLTDF